MDCLMPIKNGYEASFEIKQLICTGNYTNVRIVGYTALITEEEEEKCKYFGMDAFMIKPAT